MAGDWDPLEGLGGKINGVFDKDKHPSWGSDPVKGMKDTLSKAESAVGGALGGAKKNMDSALRGMFYPAGKTKKADPPKFKAGPSKMMMSRKFSIDGKDYTFDGDRKPSKAQMQAAEDRNRRKKNG